MLGDVVGGRGGTVVAVFQMAGDLGAVLGPVVAGAVADASGYGAAFAVSAVVALIPLPFVDAAPGNAGAGASDTPRRPLKVCDAHGQSGAPCHGNVCYHVCSMRLHRKDNGDPDIIDLEESLTR